jgi:RimJ/RimL family protein N-acetyltransferase
MLDYVYGYNEIVSQFVAGLIPHCRRGFGPNAVAMGVVKGDRLIAGIVYHNYDPEAGIIEISGAAIPRSNWITRETLRRMYQYPFLQLDCQMIAQRNPIENESLLRILAAYDYDFIKVPRMFGREKDGVLCLLTREAWENNKFNRRYHHHIVNDNPVEVAA